MDFVQSEIDKDVEAYEIYRKELKRVVEELYINRRIERLTMAQTMTNMHFDSFINKTYAISITTI